jgi:hypothetical protein
MDRLRVLVQALAPDEQYAFEAFLQRRQPRGNRLDLALFRLLAHKKAYASEALQQALYGDAVPMPTAYYALRKRLQQELFDYLTLLAHQSGGAEASEASAQLALARFFFQRGLAQWAWESLLRAEEVAVGREEYAYQAQALRLMAERWTPESPEPLPDLLERWQEAQRLADEDERASMAYCMVRERLRQVKLQGLPLDFGQLTAEILAGQGLQDAVGQRPALRLRLLAIARAAVLVRKDYHAFAPYLLEQEAQLDQAGWKPGQEEMRVGLRYMVAHVLYRSKRFAEAQAALGRLLQAMGEAPEAAAPYHAKASLLAAAIESLCGRAGEAVKVLESLLRTEGMGEELQSTALLNMAFCHFLAGDLSAAAKTMRKLNRTDAWYEQRLGVEWAFKKALAEAMFQYDLGNADGAFDRALKAEIAFRKLLSQPAYRNAKAFLMLLKSYFANPLEAERPAFAQRLEASLEFLPYEAEDLQAMAFYAWLKGKALGKPYAETLRQLLEAE